jgi:hypothetical protein
MKMEVNMVQSFPMETPNISFQTHETYFEYILLLHVYVIYFHSFVCFISRFMAFKESNFHCSLLVFNLDAHELV